MNSSKFQKLLKSPFFSRSQQEELAEHLDRFGLSEEFFLFFDGVLAQEIERRGKMCRALRSEFESSVREIEKTGAAQKEAVLRRIKEELAKSDVQDSKKRKALWDGYDAELRVQKQEREKRFQSLIAELMGRAISFIQTGSNV